MWAGLVLKVVQHRSESPSLVTREPSDSYPDDQGHTSEPYFPGNYLIHIEFIMCIYIKIVNVK